MTVPATWAELRHRHYRSDGRGLIEHRHVVRSAKHGHPGIGLAMVGLVWTDWSWQRALGGAIHLGTIAAWVFFVGGAIVGWWMLALRLAR